MGRIRITLPILLTVALVAISLACGDTESPTVNDPTTGIKSTLTINPEIIRNDGELEILYEITNHGPDTRSFHFPTPIHFGFNIEISEGDAILFPAHYMHPTTSILELLPGESHKYSIVFQCQAAANDGSYWPPELQRIPIGTHKITGGLIGYKEDIPWLEREFRVVE